MVEDAGFLRFAVFGFWLVFCDDDEVVEEDLDIMGCFNPTLLLCVVSPDGTGLEPGREFVDPVVASPLAVDINPCLFSWIAQSI